MDKKEERKLANEERRRQDQEIRASLCEIVLRKDDVRRITGFSDVTIRALEAQHNFPRRFKLNPVGRQVGWRESEVMAWIEERANSRVAA